MEKKPSYKEPSDFHNHKPWITNTYEKNITIPEPHFADTIEINIYEKGMRGNLYIGGKHIELKNDCAVFIAPRIIHSLQYTDVSGRITAIKINPAALNSLLDIESFLTFHGISWLDIPIVIDDVDQLRNLALELKQSQLTENYGDALIAIIKIFQILIKNTNSSNTSNATTPQTQSYNNEIQTVILWTEENFNKKITLDEVANMVGYTKNHFCRKFKSMTGFTYLEYLNSLKISYAKKMLKRGYSVNEVCYKSGFEDTSYFIQLFKKATGYTPKKYISLFSEK